LIDGDVIIAGKVLSCGELDSSKKIVAWSFSDKATEKILNAKGKVVYITEEIETNPELNNLKLIS
jgi:large subunit ribosomal protein L18e